MQRAVIKKEPLKEIDKGSLSDKTGFSVFCGVNGCGFVKPIGGKCPSCHARIVRESTFDSATRLFKEILEKNRHVFNSHIFTEKEKESMLFLANIGRIHYWIPFRYFVELENIESTDRSQLENFFEYIKSHCSIYNP